MIVGRGLAVLTMFFLLVLALTPAFYAEGQQGEVLRVVVGYEDDSVIGNLSAIGAQIIKKIPEIRSVAILVPSNVLHRISSMQSIRYVEIDREAKALEFSSYSDVLWNVRIINADKAWDSYYPSYGWSALGNGVFVAILDTGIYYKHPDLMRRVVWCANTVGSSTYIGYNLDKCIDKNGHGTHVAGIVAAQINNFGSAGVSPNVSLYAVKVLNDAGIGFYSDIAEGIILAVKGPDGNLGTGDDAKILSMSLGGSSDSQVLREATLWAYNNGAVLVAAAGNSGDGDPSTDNVAYPARYDWVIAVAAVDSNYNIPSWSSNGPEVDIAAPGVNVYSTYKNNQYTMLSGTSMATPHVSATVALIQALRIAQGKQPLDPGSVYKVLTSTARDIGPPGFDVYSGYGLVDTLTAINYALSLP